jgi:hypothetical protein
MAKYEIEPMPFQLSAEVVVLLERCWPDSDWPGWHRLCLAGSVRARTG